MRFRVLFGLMLLAGLVSCSRTVPIALPDNVAVQLVVFVPKAGSDKSESKEMTLPPSSSAYRELQHWFAQNQSGWKQAYPTRPTGGVFVHAGELHLQFVGDTVLLFNSKGQFQKKVQEQDYAFLKSAAGL